PPTCTRSTAIVELGGLPETGNWVLTRIQGGVTRSGSGTNATLFSLLEGVYNYTVTNADGCISDASEDIVIPAQPLTPDPPVVGEITHPSCEVPSGSVVLSNLPEEGIWTLTRFPGLITTNGNGGSTLVTGLPSGIFNFLVSNQAGCVSQASSNVVIDASPDIPDVPVTGEIIQPTCANPTGGIVLTGLPDGNWVVTRYPGGITTAGTGITTLISGLEPGSYSFTVTNSLGCTSLSTEAIDIVPDPFTPEVLVTHPAPVCEPFTVDLTDTLIVSGSTPGLTYSYWADDGATVSLENPAEVVAGIYYIRGITGEGCVDISPVMVTVLTEPFADAGPDQELNNVFETTLDAMEPIAGETGSWSVMSGTGVFADTLDAGTLVRELSVGDNMFRWSVTNDVCPPTADSVVVRVLEMVVPTLITPNNDGKNDFLVFEG
ncbi:MAG: hypothetical protein IH599_09135, partial [Bacteroidales bacterium]|nr:hypothetical protein [Bacteroidales bacterium]